MGQTVLIRDVVDMGDNLLVDTDRSFTGQDGQSMTPSGPGSDVPEALAQELFALGIGIDHVYVLQNTISVRRPGGWDQAAIDQVRATTSGFLRFYED